LAMSPQYADILLCLKIMWQFPAKKYTISIISEIFRCMEILKIFFVFKGLKCIRNRR
jgi:hypothetical protein